MAQIGLADTLKLLAAGYKKKDIDALAALDEKDPAPAKGEKDPAPAKDENDPAPAQDPQPDVNEDLKKELEAKQQEMNELLEKLKENDEKIKKLQQENINRDSGPAAAEAKQKEAEALQNLVKSFM